MADIANMEKHFTPETLYEEVEKMPTNVPI
jgi:hypothetical protein